MRGRIAARALGLSESATIQLHDRVESLRQAGRTLINLAAGDPDQDTPATVRQAAIDALNAGFTRYVPSRGIPALLTEIARKLHAENDLQVAAANLIVTPSAKHALHLAVMTLVDPGDEVIVPTPSWVSYRSIIELAGGVPVELPLHRGNNYRIDAAALEASITSRTRAILLNSPNNPTGRVLSLPEMQAIVAAAESNQLMLISDEVYERFAYAPHRHVSIASLPGAQDRTLTVNGFSKAFAMTGWRLGYLAGPEDIIEQALKVHQHTVSCAGSFVQAGAVAALQAGSELVQKMVQAYERRARMVVSMLDALPGIRCTMPEGGIYVFADVSNTPQGNGNLFAEKLLENTGVMVTPGSAFGTGGENCVRLALTSPDETLIKAVDLIGKMP